MSEIINVIIERDTYDSILYAVLGVLFILSVYHLAIYTQNRDKSYLIYSCYTFLSFLAYMTVTESGFLFDLSNYLNLDFNSKKLFTILFNSTYFLFFAHFLNVKKTSKIWFRIIVLPIYLFIGIALIGFAILKFWNIHLIFDSFYTAFVYLITIHTIISFYILTKVKNRLKYYIIFGGLVLYLCSILGEEAVRHLPALNLTRKAGDFIYFVGLMVENMAFSFALGRRQRINNREKVLFNRNLIAEMQKNVKLKDKINIQHQRRLEIENERIKYEQKISDLKLSLLQNQMNPHFIFNALNSIKYYILENDSENAVNYLTKFSKIIRTILISSTVKEFTLEEELQTLQVYVDIENLRFSKNINFNIIIDNQIDTTKIKLPPMVLQPFIENAILHGVAMVEEKKIDLRVEKDLNMIKIIITDNGIGRKEASKIQTQNKQMGNSLGTKIADGMLKNYFGPDSYKIKYHDLQQNDKPSGTTVVLEIPFP